MGGEDVPMLQLVEVGSNELVLAKIRNISFQTNITFTRFYTLNFFTSN